MSARLLLLLLLASGCSFNPDLSRYEPCGEGGHCAEGFTCLASESRCVPACAGDACPAPVEPLPVDPGDSGTPDGGGPLALVTEALAPTVEGAPYTQALEADGGVAPYAFRQVGALPAGLALSAEGVLSGALAADAGTYRVVAEVQDSASPPASVQREWSLQVRALLQLTGPGTLAQAREGNAYAEQLSSLGGQEPYRYSLEPGSTPPPGITFADGGAVTGASGALAAGTFAFTVRVTDSATPPQSATRELNLTVAPSVLLGAPLAVTTRALPEARVGFPYHHQLRFEPGSASPTWNVGTLPAGLTFGQASGILSGTPSTRGSYRVSVSLSEGLTTTEPVDFALEVR